MARGLAMASIPHRGHEVLHIHADILHTVLQIKYKGEEEDSLLTRDVSWTQYFQLLADLKLRWHDFVQPMLPLMPLSTACHFLNKLVEFLKMVVLENKEVTVGVICLCVGGLELGLNALLDLLLKSHCEGIEYENSVSDSSIDSLLTLTKSCCDILLHILESKRGLDTCLACDATFRVTTHALMLLLFVICPALSVDLSHAHLQRYLIKSQPKSSKADLSLEDRAKKRKKTLRQQKQESLLPLCEVALTKTDIPLTSKDMDVGEEGSDKNRTLNNHCHSVISKFKSKCGTDICEKIVSIFCFGPLEDGKSFYKSLAKVAVDPEVICVGRHSFSYLVIQEQIFSLLWFLTNQGDVSFPTECHSLNTKELLAQLEKFWVLEGPGSHAQEVVHRMRQSGKMFPDQLLTLHMSEADRVLGSRRQLGGDDDLALLVQV
ncbi:hypothetical protein EGW08_020571, partial [Elysia chlorotica]